MVKPVLQIACVMMHFIINVLVRALAILQHDTGQAQFAVYFNNFNQFYAF